MSRWLQSIGTALEKLDDGASQGVQALRDTLAAPPSSNNSSTRRYSTDNDTSSDEEYDDEYYEEDDGDDDEDSNAADDENEEEDDDEDALAISEPMDSSDDAPRLWQQPLKDAPTLDHSKDEPEDGRRKSLTSADCASCGDFGAVPSEPSFPITVDDSPPRARSPDEVHKAALRVSAGNSEEEEEQPLPAAAGKITSETGLLDTPPSNPVNMANTAPLVADINVAILTKGSFEKNESSPKLGPHPPFPAPLDNIPDDVDKFRQEKQTAEEVLRLRQTIDELENRYRTDISKLMDKQTRMEQQHKQQQQKSQLKYSNMQQQQSQQQDALTKQVELLQTQLDHANNELVAQQRELDQAAHDIQQERQGWKEERQELLEEQEQERLEWQAQQQETGREQDGYYQAKIRTLESQLQEATRQSKAQQAEAAKLLQASLAREESAQNEIRELSSSQSNLKSQLEQSVVSVAQLQESIAALSSSLRASQDRERSAELKLDAALEQHQHQMSQRQSRQVDLERTVQELGAALSRQQQQLSSGGGVQSIHDEQYVDVNRVAEAATSGGQATGELSWKEKYEMVADELDSLRVQCQLSQQRCQALESEVEDITRERATELRQAQDRQNQQDLALQEVTVKLHRMESESRDRTLATSDTGSAETASIILKDPSLQQAIREASQAKQQVSAMSDQVIRQQGTIDSYKSEILALKGRLQAANTRADAAELQISAELESGSEGPYGPTPSKLRRRVKGGRFGRKFGARSMRATLGFRAAPLGSIQESIGGTLDAFDRWLVDTVDILRNEPLARIAFSTYLAILHAWCFALVAFHTIQSEHADLGALTRQAGPLHPR